MTVTAMYLFNRLTDCGFTLTCSEGNLQIDGPEHLFTPELQANVREKKQELLRILGTEVVHVKEPEQLLEVDAFVKDLKINKVYLDTETTGLDPMTAELVLIQAKAAHRVFIIHVQEIGTGAILSFCWDALQGILDDPGILKVGHNLKFDLKFLTRLYGEKAFGLKVENVFDTYLAEALLTAGLGESLSLKAVAKKYAGVELDKSEQTGFGKGPLSDSQIRYAVNDVAVLEPIFAAQKQALVKAGLVDVALLEFSIVPAIVDMELRGMRIDTGKLGQLKASTRETLCTLEEDLRQIVKGIPMNGQQTMFGNGMNFRSPAQVKVILEKLGYPVESTATETLSKVNHPFAQKLVQHRKQSKLMSSFIEALPKHINPVTGRIHADFFQIGSEAGRFTCEKPNLQQIPHEQEWRDLFIAPEGYSIVTADYSQIELRVLAEFSQDPAFLEAYHTRQDLHRKTAANIFQIPEGQVTKEQRNVAKTINFGLVYGMSAPGLASRLNIAVDEAESFINRFYRGFPKVKACLQQLGIKAVTQLQTETLAGRKRHFKLDPQASTKPLERKGRNTPIQGSSADITKKAIAYLSKSLRGIDCRLVNVIHDELVFEVAENQVDQAVTVIERDMVKAGQDYLKTVPVEVGICVGPCWKK